MGEVNSALALRWVYAREAFRIMTRRDVSVLGFAAGFALPEGLPALPPAREFFVSPGFGGVAVLVAVLVVAVVVVFAVRAAANRYRLQVEEQERHRREDRDDARRAAAISECWRRFRWMVDVGSIEPAASQGATLGPGPKLTVAVLRGLLDDAEALGDKTLAKAVAAHLDQFSKVLALQGGLLSVPASVSPPAAEADGKRQSASTPLEPAPVAAVDATPAPARKAAATGTRRRRQ